MSFEAAEVHTDGYVAELRLSRPDVMNAFDDLLVNELPGVLVELARDTSVRSVVWTSTGSISPRAGTCRPSSPATPTSTC